MNIEFSKTDKTKAHLILLLFLFGAMPVLASLLMFGVFTFFSSEELADARMRYEIVTDLSAYFLLAICLVWSLIIYGMFIIAEQIFTLHSFSSGKESKN